MKLSLAECRCCCDTRMARCQGLVAKVSACYGTSTWTGRVVGGSRTAPTVCVSVARTAVVAVVIGMQVVRGSGGLVLCRPSIRGGTGSEGVLRRGRRNELVFLLCAPQNVAATATTAIAVVSTVGQG